MADAVYKINFLKSDGTTQSVEFAVPQGEDGKDGVSPAVSVAQMGNSAEFPNGGAKITIVDESHPDGQLIELRNGSDGKDGLNGTDGINGKNGQDGRSPSVAVNEYSNGHTVWIGYDGDGTTESTGEQFFVPNGRDGKSYDIQVEQIEGGHKVSIIDDGVAIKQFEVLNGKNGDDGSDGVSIEGAAINTNGHLVLTMSDRSTMTVGRVRGQDGKDGITPTFDIKRLDADDGYEVSIYNDDYLAQWFVIRDGTDGIDGKDGDSPTISLDRVLSGTRYVNRLTINNVDGTTSSVDIKDGVSPTVNVYDTANGHRVEITDKNGTKSFDVLDGSGSGGSSGGGVVDWDRNIINRPFGDVFVGYESTLFNSGTLTYFTKGVFKETEPLTFLPVIGQAYKITGPGFEAFDAYAKEYVIDGVTYIGLGNVDYVLGTGDNDEPAAFLVSTELMYGTSSSYVYATAYVIELMKSQTSSTGAFKVVGPHLSFTDKIDPRFLPEKECSWNELSDKPFGYLLEGEHVIYDESSLVRFRNINFYDGTFTMPIQAGQKFVVACQREDWSDDECMIGEFEATEVRYNNAAYMAIGHYAGLKNTSSSSSVFPCVVLVHKNGQGGGMIRFFGDSFDSYKCRITVKGQHAVLKKIDEEFLPDAVASLSGFDPISSLVENDMLPAIHDNNGRILTDKNKTIILRY